MVYNLNILIVPEEIEMNDNNTTSHILNTPHTDAGLPETASRVIKVPQKRGRKGDKIAKAFFEIPEIPVNFEEYARDHNVSPNVLRQIKRHDRYTDTGRVFVRKNKHSKTMMIWREKAKTT